MKMSGKRSHVDPNAAWPLCEALTLAVREFLNLGEVAACQQVSKAFRLPPDQIGLKNLSCSNGQLWRWLLPPSDLPALSRYTRKTARLRLEWAASSAQWWFAFPKLQRLHVDKVLLSPSLWRDLTTSCPNLTWLQLDWVVESPTTAADTSRNETKDDDRNMMRAASDWQHTPQRSWTHVHVTGSKPMCREHAAIFLLFANPALLHWHWVLHGSERHADSPADRWWSSGQDADWLKQATALLLADADDANDVKNSVALSTFVTSSPPRDLKSDKSDGLMLHLASHWRQLTELDFSRQSSNWMDARLFLDADTVRQLYASPWPFMVDLPPNQSERTKMIVRSPAWPDSGLEQQLTPPLTTTYPLQRLRVEAQPSCMLSHWSFDELARLMRTSKAWRSISIAQRKTFDGPWPSHMSGELALELILTCPHLECLRLECPVRGGIDTKTLGAMMLSSCSSHRLRELVLETTQTFQTCSSGKSCRLATRPRLLPVVIGDDGDEDNDNDNDNNVNKAAPALVDILAMACARPGLELELGCCVWSLVGGSGAAQSLIKLATGGSNRAKSVSFWITHQTAVTLIALKPPLAESYTDPGLHLDISWSDGDPRADNEYSEWFPLRDLSMPLFVSRRGSHLPPVLVQLSG